jgi:hypothetical protein
MTRKLTNVAVCAVFLLVFSQPAISQQPPRPEQDNPPQQTPLPMPPGQDNPVPAERNFEGHLTKVNLAAQIITVKGEDDKEMMFVYNDETQMSGIENTPQGLIGKTGTRLKVTYKESRGINLAIRLEGSQSERREQ